MWHRQCTPVPLHWRWLRGLWGALKYITWVFLKLVCRKVCFANITLRSSEKSRTSKCENRVHWILWGRSEVVSCIAQLMATRNKTGEGIQHCRTPDLTGRLCPSILEDDNTLEVFTKFPGDDNNLEWYSVCPIKVLLKTLVTVECLKVKLKNKGTFHSMHCSLMFRRAKTLSLQPPPFWNPACSCLNFKSMAPSILLRNNL